MFIKSASLTIKALFAIIASIALIVMDHYFKPFIDMRSKLDTAVSPFYYVVKGSSQMISGLSTLVETKDDLLKSNKELEKKLILQRGKTLLFNQLQHENAKLRQLLNSPAQYFAEKVLVEVLSHQSGYYDNQIIINKGNRDGVSVGQPVIDDSGIVGQVYAVSQANSRVILLCDAQHALPVQVLRNNARFVAKGDGCTRELLLEFLPDDVNIKEGDQLITSGLGGHFPEGYPVGVVVSINREPQSGHLIIRAKPNAELKNMRYLLLLESVSESSLSGNIDE